MLAHNTYIYSDLSNLRFDHAHYSNGPSDHSTPSSATKIGADGKVARSGECNAVEPGKGMNCVVYYSSQWPNEKTGELETYAVKAYGAHYDHGKERDKQAITTRALIMTNVKTGKVFTAHEVIKN